MTTEERLAKVEGELARAKRHTRTALVAVGLIAAVSLLGLIGVHGCEPREGGRAPVKQIRANRFVVEDQNGRLCAVLGMTGDGPELRLYDERSQMRAAVFANKIGTGLVLKDEKGNYRAGLTLYKSGAMLALFDENRKPIWTTPTVYREE